MNPMSQNAAKNVDFTETSRLIRRELRTESNGRFLRGLPAFKTEYDLPDEMRDLLSQLERAERSQAG